MKIFICRICSKVYLGENIPGSCPFCGVGNKYFRLAHIWKEENDIELSDLSKANLKKALKIEISNTSFYNCAAKTLSNQEASIMFKGLADVEYEHAKVFQRLLKAKEMPEIVETCTDDTEACLAESLRREKMAVEFYARAAQKSVEPRVREVFLAIMDTEKDHIALDNEMKNKSL